MDLLLKACGFVFILGTVMVVHELGHYLVARRLKIRVEIFSFVGLGPRVWGFRRGPTDYRISLIPLGAYVKLGGDDSNAALEGGNGASDIPDEENFSLRPKWQKIAVALGGPLANIVTALVASFIGAWVIGIQPSPPPSPFIFQVETGGGGERGGMQPGDRIVSFAGQVNPTWSEIDDAGLLIAHKPQPATFVVERQGQRLTVEITPQVVQVGADKVGSWGLVPDYEVSSVVIGRVVPGSGAAQAGLRFKDRLLLVNGEKVRNRRQVAHIIRTFQQPLLPVVVERNGQTLDFAVPVTYKPDEGSSTGEQFGFLGINMDERQRVGVGRAAGYALETNWRMLQLTGRALWQLVRGERSVSDTVTGPVGMARATAQAVEGGWGTVLGMLGFLSLSLGFFNLFPIPMLDGGMVFMLLLEAVMGLFGWQMTMKVRHHIQTMGLFVLVLLTAFVLTYDVAKLFGP